MYKIIIAVFFAFLASCHSLNTTGFGEDQTLTEDSSHIYIVPYSDFGPPQLSARIIGNKWWQWDDPDNDKPVTYDVKVVVYRDVSLERVKRAFLVVPEHKQDYRYVDYETASAYFEQQIAKFESEMRAYDNPSDVGRLYVYPLKMYKTALAMEKKLRR